MKNHISKKQYHPIRLLLMVVSAMSIVIISACGSSVEKPPSPTTTATSTIEVVNSGPISVDEPTKIPLDLPTEDSKTEPTPTVSFIDVCSLVTAYDVENVLGQTVTSITPGAEPDETSDSTINYCTYLGSGRAVVISSVEVENSSIGGDILRSQLQSNKDDEPDALTSEELGVGVQAYWSISEHAGGYTVLTEEHVFSVALGGKIGNPVDHKAALLTLAQIVADNQ